MKKTLTLATLTLLAACSSHKPLPMHQAAVSVWDISPGTSQLRQSGGGTQYEFTITGPEKRGIATMRLFDPNKADVQFLLLDFKSVDNFVVAGKQSRFQCGTQRPETGVEYHCSWKGKTLKEAHVTQVADGLRVSVPAEVFENGEAVRLEWLEYWR